MKRVVLFVVVCCFTIMGIAQAETIHFDNTSPGLTVSINAPTLPYYGGTTAGMYNFSISGGTGLYTGYYKGNCVDPEFDVVDFSADILAVTKGSRYEAAAYLLGKYYNNTIVDNLKAAQVQLAIWELVWDFPTVYDLASGNFSLQTADYNTYNAAVTSLIIEATGALSTFNPSGYYIVASPQGGNLGDSYDKPPQDFMFQRVPEPAAILLFGLGLLGLAVLRRKFKKSN